MAEPDLRFRKDPSYDWDQLIRDLIDLQAQVAAQQEEIDDLKTRVDALENP